MRAVALCPLAWGRVYCKAEEALGERMISVPDLVSCASHNMEVFDKVLAPYVSVKLEQVVSKLPHGKARGWLDASGCVWCLFDDESFVRSGDAGRRLLAEKGKDCGLQVYWSMGDVLMPGTCDERWVAERIVEEAIRQLSNRGYRCAAEEREVDGETHLGVIFRKKLLSGLR